jgi:hypothetical protein
MHDHTLTAACGVCCVVVSLCTRNPTPQLAAMPCILKRKENLGHGCLAVLCCPRLRYNPALARHATPHPLHQTSHQLAIARVRRLPDRPSCRECVLACASLQSLAACLALLRFLSPLINPLLLYSAL